MTLFRRRLTILLLLDTAALLFIISSWKFQWLDFTLLKGILADLVKLAQRITKETDPNSIWLYFILIILTLSFLSMAPFTRWSPKSPKPKPVQIGGRLDFWYWEMHWYYQETILTRYSILELKKLTLQAIAFQRQITVDEAEAWVRSSRDSLPQEVRWLFQIETFSPEQGLPEEPGGPWQEMLKLLKEVTGWPKPQPVSRTHFNQEDHQRIEAVIQYLEQEIGMVKPGEQT